MEQRKSVIYSTKKPKYTISSIHFKNSKIPHLSKSARERNTHKPLFIANIEIVIFIFLLFSMNNLSMVAWVLVVVGGVNWGLVGLSMLAGGGNWNVVNLLLGSWPTVEAVVYLLVGVSAVYSLVGCKKMCK